MQFLAPLLQTLLWVALITGLVFRFHKPIYDLLTALAARVSGGSGVKLGPVEITAHLLPQDPASQRQKAEPEISEIIRGELDATLAAPIPRQTAEARYYQAEDLALRALQNEFGVSMSRQVTTGRDSGFDGVFTKGNRIYVVEVKYYTSFANIEKLRTSVERIEETLRKLAWPNVTVLLVVVFEQPSAMEKYEPIIRQALPSEKTEVQLKFYSLPALRTKFGIGPPLA